MTSLHRNSHRLDYYIMPTFASKFYVLLFAADPPPGSKPATSWRYGEKMKQKLWRGGSKIILGVDAPNNIYM